VLQHLNKARGTARMGMSASQLGELLEVDGLQLEPVLETLVELDWIGQLNDAEGSAESRYLLLVDPDATPLAPLMQKLLLDRAPSVNNLWENARWRMLHLRDAL
jgi:membrane protein